MRISHKRRGDTRIETPILCSLIFKHYITHTKPNNYTFLNHALKIVINKMTLSITAFYMSNQPILVGDTNISIFPRKSSPLKTELCPIVFWVKPHSIIATPSEHLFGDADIARRFPHRASCSVCDQTGAFISTENERKTVCLRCKQSKLKLLQFTARSS